MLPDKDPKLWFPARFTLGGHSRPWGTSDVRKYAVIILNNPLENTHLLISICRKALCVICADGGANRLKDLSLDSTESKLCSPKAICGDLDSIRRDVEQHYRDQGVEILKDPDQYATDLTKCLKYLGDLFIDEMARTQLDVAIFGSLGGRADQAFSQLHHLYANPQRPLSPICDLYLITPESVMFLLEKGSNRISAPAGADNFTENVGIIPLGRPSTITTRGLEWDVTHWETDFGSQMSTSNHMKSDIIEIETTERVLFTMETAQKS